MSKSGEEPATPHLAVQGLCKTYGDIVALDEVTLSLEGPSIVGLVGPNGAGKTTLIKILLALVDPDEGETEVFGQEPTHLFTADGPRVGYMPQGLAIYPELTIRENVRFFARLYRIARERADEAIEAAVGTVDLAHRIDDRVAPLSGGMQRRVSLACALVHQPQFAVLDEPTVGVDPDLRARMWSRFGSLREAGGLLLMSTHYMEEANRCDEVVFLREGRLLAVDEPAALLERAQAEDLESAFRTLAQDDREVPA